MKFLKLNSHGNYLYGSFHEVQNSSKPAILLVHGYFSSNRIGPSRLFYEMGKYLSGNGYETFRFDLCGMGESDGEIENVKHNDHVEDIITILNFIQSNYNKNVIILGHCIGAITSLQAAMSIDKKINKIIMLSPMILEESTLISFFKDLDYVNRAFSNDGYAYRKSMFASASFFGEDYSIERISFNCDTVNDRLYIIAGTMDQYISKNCYDKLGKNLKKDIYWIEGGCHNFIETFARKNLFKEIIKICDK